MSDEATKNRKPRPESYLVVGSWKDGVFTAAPTQPTAKINDLHKMIAWTKETYGETSPGRYEFIRTVQGALTLAKQTVLDSSWA